VIVTVAMGEGRVTSCVGGCVVFMMGKNIGGKNGGGEG
jgi:hypothetical protein